MRIKTYIAIIILCKFCMIANSVSSQETEQFKKIPNLSLCLTTEKNRIKRSHFNFGLLSNVSQLQGSGINLFSGIVQNDLTGLQVSTLGNITGSNSTGIQVSAIANIIGGNSYGTLINGLVNITDKQVYGLQIAGLGNISGEETYGLTIGGLINVTGKKQYGVTISGLTNMNDEGMDGLQVSGIMNICGKESRGIQIAGINNVSSSIKGIQFSAINNIVSKELCGIQLSGVVNIATHSCRAFQISGITNICPETIRGAQLAVSNYAGGINGVQLGLLNLCGGKVKGVQIGIINHSKDTTARKIGLVNLTPKTHIQAMTFGGNTSKFNLGIRFKNQLIYTLLGFGTHYLDLNEKFSGSLFYRAGLYFPIMPKLELSGDLGFFHVENFQNSNTENPDRLYSLQARINLEYQITSKLGLFASGGYATTHYYKGSSPYKRNAIIEAGIVLF